MRIKNFSRDLFFHLFIDFALISIDKYLKYLICLIYLDHNQLLFNS